MIKWVTVLINKSDNKIVHVKEMDTPFRDELNPNIRDIVAENQSTYTQKSFSIECNPDVDSSFLLKHLMDDGRPNSIPSINPTTPPAMKAKVTRQITEATGNLDFDDRKIAYNELVIENSKRKVPLVLDDTMLFKRVDDNRKARL